jgi:hypothetical protein
MNFMTVLLWERLSSLIKTKTYHISYSNSLKQLGLFAVLVCLAAIGCKKPDESLGDNLQPAEDLLYAAVTDSFLITAFTEKIDSLRTDVFANVMAGNYVDEHFGSVKCRAVMQFSPDLTQGDLPLEFDVYSVVLSLAYQPEAYGSNNPMYFEVNEVLETLNLDSAYFSNQLPARNVENLILPGKEIFITRSEYAALTSQDPIEYLHIPLNVELGERLLAVDSVLDSFEEFREYFKGLIISSRTNDGRVVSFSNTSCEITVRYAYETDKETVLGSYTFPFTTSCEAYSVVEHQYFSSPLQGLAPDNPKSAETLGYLQATGGTRMRINIGDVRRLGEIPGITINKAELILPYDDDSKFAGIDTLTIVYEREPDVFSATRDFSRNSGGNFRNDDGYFRFNLTSHIQHMLLNNIANDEVLVVVNPRVRGLFNSSGVRRSIVHGTHFDAEDNTQNLRLVVTYTY